jgi:hypothetical protein
MPMPEFFEAVRNYRNKGDNPKNLSWFRVTVNTVSVAWELSMMRKNRAGTKVVCFSGEITETKVTNQRNYPGFKSC